MLLCNETNQMTKWGTGLLEKVSAVQELSRVVRKLTVYYRVPMSPPFRCRSREWFVPFVSSC